MVNGYGSSDKEQLSWVVYSSAGAVSGFVTRAVTQPLDVVKIRMQIQDNPASFTGCTKYRSTCQAARRIFIEEGTMALWKGHVPAQFLSISYGVIQFSCFEMLTKMTYPTLRRHPFLVHFDNFLCGSIAGISATFISYPFDVIRTRLIMQGYPKAYNSMVGAFKTIILRESMGGLYKGLLPTVVQIAPNTGFQFAFYHLSSSFWNYLHHEINPETDLNKPTGVLKSLMCGSLAGLGAKTATYPLDFVKKRLQMIGYHQYGCSIVGRPHKYRGLVDCFITVVREEGTLALYKGLSPSLLKAISTSALIFCSYEQFLKLFSSAYSNITES